MTRAEVTVEVEWQTGVWTDVTDRFLSLTTSRGRSQRSEQPDPAETTVRLDNSDRAFDPTNPDSPWWPHVYESARLRVTALWDSTTWPVAAGVIEDLPMQWAAGAGEVTVTVTGAWRSLRTAVPTVWRQAMEASEPAHWWRFGDQDDVARDRGATPRHGIYSHGTDPEGESLVPYDTQGGVALDGEGQRIGLNPSAAAPVVTRPWTLQAWVQVGDQDDWDFRRILTKGAGGVGSDLVLVRLAAAGTLPLVRVGWNEGASVRSREWVAGPWSGQGPPSWITDGQPHHLVIRCNSSGTLTGWLDGEQLALWDSSGAAFNTSLLSHEGAAIGGPVISGFDSWNGGIDEVAVWTRVLSPAEIAELHTAGRAPFAGDRIGVQAGWVLDAIGWDRPTDIADGDVPHGPLDVDTADNALDLLRNLAAAERSLVHSDAAGDVTILARFDPQRPPRNYAAWELSDQPDAALPISTAVVSRNVDELVNDVTVTPRSGIPVRRVDQPSVDRHGRRTLEVDLASVSDEHDAAALADHLIATRSEPRLTIDQVTLRPTTFEALWPVVLTVDLEDRVAVSVQPTGDGPALEVDAHVQHIAHTIGDTEWVTVLTLAAADPTGVLICDDDELGKLDTGTVAY